MTQGNKRRGKRLWLSHVQVYASTKGAEFKRGKFPWEKVKKQTKKNKLKKFDNTLARPQEYI